MNDTLLIAREVCPTLEPNLNSTKAWETFDDVTVGNCPMRLLRPMSSPQISRKI